MVAQPGQGPRDGEPPASRRRVEPGRP
jgi:hypothetical protein